MTKHKSQDERRGQILTAAKTCFIRNGYANTRVDDIANEAALSKGGVYFHFKSKRAILDALYEQQRAETMAVVSGVNAANHDPAEQLRALAVGLLLHFNRAEDQRKFLIVLAEMGIRDPDLHQSIRDAHQRYVDALTSQIANGVELGTFRKVDPRQTALLLKMIIDGIEQGLALGYDIDVNALLPAGLDVLLGGLLSRD
jgi:AcrR family transcriptional regulator